MEAYDAEFRGAVLGLAPEKWALILGLGRQLKVDGR